MVTIPPAKSVPRNTTAQCGELVATMPTRSPTPDALVLQHAPEPPGRGDELAERVLRAGGTADQRDLVGVAGGGGDDVVGDRMHRVRRQRHPRRVVDTAFGCTHDGSLAPRFGDVTGSISPPAPVADLSMPWDAVVPDPVAAIAAARDASRRHVRRPRRGHRVPLPVLARGRAVVLRRGRGRREQGHRRLADAAPQAARRAVPRPADVPARPVRPRRRGAVPRRGDDARST